MTPELQINITLAMCLEGFLFHEGVFFNPLGEEISFSKFPDYFNNSEDAIRLVEVLRSNFNVYIVIEPFEEGYKARVERQPIMDSEGNPVEYADPDSWTGEAAAGTMEAAITLMARTAVEALVRKGII